MTVPERTRQARERMQSVIERICGACENSCCHQGTMMGGHDALRLAKGMALDLQLRATVREGLSQRARELRADLATLERVRGLIADAGMGSEEDLRALDEALGRWRDYCEFIAGPWPPNVESLREMLKFAGIWALTTRAMASFPGGHSALANFAEPDSGFQFRRRKLAPPRCLFHSKAHGCLAGRWKPGKCANFFCTGDPNVLDELRRQLSFDDFVLSNAEVIPPDAVVATVRDELDLGRQFAEPKVFLGASADIAKQVAETLRDEFGQVEYLDLGGVPGPLQVDDWSGLLDPADENFACLAHAKAMSGADLYELAIALDMRRAEGCAMPAVVVIDQLASGAPPHPMWEGSMMRQPLGMLDLFVLQDA